MQKRKKMNSSLALFAIATLAILVSNSPILGQERDLKWEMQQAQRKRDALELESAAAISEAARELSIKVKKGNEAAILDAGRTGDMSLVPLLEVLAKQGVANAEVALVSLGKDDYLTRILNQTKQGENIKVRYSAVRKLTLIANKTAYQRLYELLDDTLAPVSELDDVAFAPVSSVVMLELSKNIDNPPCKGAAREKVPCWKNWLDTKWLQK